MAAHESTYRRIAVMAGAHDAKAVWVAACDTCGPLATSVEYDSVVAAADRHLRIRDEA